MPLLRNPTPHDTPTSRWIVQKYGGTSVGKFCVQIAKDIVPSYLRPSPSLSSHSPSPNNPSTHSPNNPSSNDPSPLPPPRNKIAIVCSARSGSTKALGTTNLLLRAASEALASGPAVRRGVVHENFVSSPGTPTGTGTGLFTRSPSPSPSPREPREPRSGSFSSSHSHSNSGSVVSFSALQMTPQSHSPSPQSPTTSTPTKCDIDTSPPAPTIPPHQTTISLLLSEHLTAARTSVRDPDILRELEYEIQRDCHWLGAFLGAAVVIDEISPRSRDNIVGLGERLACKIVAAVLRDQGIDAEYVSLENIVPDGDELDGGGSGSAPTLDQTFYDRLSVALGERLRACEESGRVPVVTGFFGPVPGSLLHQIGRGYTDLLSALLAVGLGAEELQIWKEVDGIFTADPRKVLTARLIPTISPDEAAELTYYGSEVVHPFTMEQVIRKKIPIRIKNVENPKGGGTVIQPDSSPSHSPSRRYSASSSSPTSPTTHLTHPTQKLPTAVTIKENITVLNINSNRKSVSHGFLAGIFGTLDRFGVVVDLISTSEVHVSMALEGGGGGEGAGGNGGKNGKLERLIAELRKSGSVSIHPDMAILSLVGKQMRNMVGIAGRMFTTLAQGNVNIEMISQGASEINISCVIEGRDAVKALNLIHQSCLQIREEGVRGRVGPWLF